MAAPPSKAASFPVRGHRRLPPLANRDSEDVVDARLSGETQRGTDEGGATPVYESPITFSTQSARSEPGLGKLRSRKTKSPTTATPQSAQSIEQPLGQPKKYIADKSITKALKRSILHVLPVLVTSVLFVLSAAEVYMSDLDGFPGQDVALQALQFVVKAHEILMTMSLADIVLHRIRWDLIVQSGVPFGLLSSAYQLGDLGYLFSSEFRASAWRPSSHDPSLSRLTLSLLVAVSCLLSLVVGPSSGVLFIPKLSWWPLKKPFGSTDLRLFISYSSQDLAWPNPLPSYDCNGWICPGYGAGTIGTWAGSLMYNDASAQIPFIDGGDNFYRWLLSNATDYNGWTASTSPMMTMSTLVGQYWNWISYQGLAPTVSLTQPQLSLAFVDNGIIHQPLVQVQCSVHYSDDNRPDLELPNNQLSSTQSDAYTNLVWPISSNYSNANLSNYAQNVYWTRLLLENYTNAPSEGLVFVLMDEHEQKVTLPCSLLAHWVPSDISIYPKTDRNLHDDPYSNPITIVNRSDVDLSPSAQLTFSDDWWALLFPDDDSTPMEDILHGISMGAGADGLQLYHADSQGLAYRVSTMVGMFFADAIARYVSVQGPNVTTNMVYQDPHNGSQPFAQDLGYFELPHTKAPEGYSNWVEYAEANSSEWREATMTVKRYGYAWSFSGLLTKFAGLALLFQSILAIGHVALVISGRWSSSAWDSIGNMLALALRSHSPAVPPDHRTGDEKKETWAETVSVRLVENDLELMFNPLRAETLRLLQR